MTDDRPTLPRQTPPRTGKTAERQAREADALRANLARRKSHQRARQAAQAAAENAAENVADTTAPNASPAASNNTDHGADT